MKFTINLLSLLVALAFTTTAFANTIPTGTFTCKDSKTNLEATATINLVDINVGNATEQVPFVTAMFKGSKDLNANTITGFATLKTIQNRPSQLLLPATNTANAVVVFDNRGVLQILGIACSSF